MTSIKIKLRESSVENKQGVMFFQIIHRREVKVITTQFKLHPDEWDAKREVVVFGSEKGMRREYLETVARSLEFERKVLLTVIEKLDYRGQYIASQVVDSYLGSALSGYLFPFLKAKITELCREGRMKTAASYDCTMKVFAKYREGEDVLIDRLDARLLKAFEDHMKSRNVSLNTISYYMRILRAAYNQAVEIGLAIQHFPFKNVYTGIDKTAKRAVDEKVIHSLRGLDLSHNVGLNYSRDLFLFSFYTRGMSFVDLANLKKENIRSGILRYKRSKTGQNLSIKVEQCMEEILGRYASENSDFIFPILSLEDTSLKKYSSALRLHNKRLNKISALLNLDTRLTSYVARHTWASVAKSKGIPLNIISEGMGHHSEEMTRIYLTSIDQKIIDKANLLIISDVRRGKSKR